MATTGARVAGLIVSPRLAAARRLAADAGAALRLARPEITLYYQAGDAWSHLCAQLLPGLRERVDADFRVVVVPPAADGSNAAPELGPPYALLDAQRVAPAWGLAIPPAARLPEPDLREAGERALLGAADLDQFLAWERVVTAALWAGHRDALAELTPAPDPDAVLAKNLAELQARGHYQGGMWHFRGEWYWALDRLPYLEARLRGLGRVHGDQPLTRLDPSRAALPAATGRADELDFFFSFRSPYSYIAVDAVAAVAERHGVRLNVRPVLPMVMRGLKVPRAKRLYIVRDTKREADRLGVPFGRLADPLGGGVERCLALFPHFAERGEEVPFLRAVGRAVWAEGRPVRKARVMRRVLAAAGLDADVVDRYPPDAAPRYAEANREALTELGLWGVPSFRAGNLATWGQDRLWLVEEALRRV
ncbi:2-hydroxychromene-2-carboxylate isomerase [Salinisphaera sp. PC39]|uniref:DsbA family protein n=1 Tax=Salinisphaera sp. PC39 TaxID=1304156 RepID=UPI00333F1DFD